MEQNRTPWAAGILALKDEINTTFRSRKLIHQKKCDVFNKLVDSTAHYVQLWSIGQFREEIITWSEDAEAVGKELLGVLKRGLRLLQQCGEKEFAKSYLIIFCTAGEFCEIIDDVERYSNMMNKLIARILELDPVDKLDKKKLIKQLQDKVKIECNRLQYLLTSAHTQDSNTLEMLVGGKVLQPSKFSIQISDRDLKFSESLGGGSYGNVSKGFWFETIPVAIKQFFSDECFEYEYNIFKILVETNCSHIVQLLGHSQLRINSKTTGVLVLELMDMDLKKLMLERYKKQTNPSATGPFSLYESTDLMLQIAKGLRDLHRAQVVHRDIKPANILVKTADDGSWTIKLADFGEAKAHFQTKNNNHTKKRGTTSYMAPEMAAGDEDEGKYSRKVDVYSYGLVCEEILTGRQPKPNTPMEKGQMHSFLYTTISNCLEVDPNKRPSFEEICERLWDFKDRILIKQVQQAELADQIRKATFGSRVRADFS